MSNHQRETESYEKIFTYLDGSGRETRRKSEFQDKLDQVDDIDKYKVNVRLLQRDGEFELNNRHGYTPLFFALWLISEDSDAGIGLNPEIDDWVQLLVLKGSDVEYTHDGVSVLDYFQSIKDFYMNEELDNICEECKKEDESVSQNLIKHGYKVCNSCYASKTIFPV